MKTRAKMFLFALIAVGAQIWRAREHGRCDLLAAFRTKGYPG
jgi:hypothetical protein